MGLIPHPFAWCQNWVGHYTPSQFQTTSALRAEAEILCLRSSNFYRLSGINITAVDSEGRKKLIDVVKTARGSISQRAFGKLLGVSPTAVQLWEKGELIPDTQNLAQIADKAGYTMEELLHYLGLKQTSETSDVNQIVKQIKLMPLSEVAIIAQAAAARFAVVAQSINDGHP